MPVPGAVWEFHIGGYQVLAWPWEGSQLALRRETVWPYLIRLLPDRDEAERWRRDLAVEAARLDAASG